MFTKKGVELPINLIIVAILAMVVMVIVFAILTGRLSGVTQSLSECRAPARCIGTYATENNGAPVSGTACDSQFETEQPGTFIQSGQASSTAVDKLVRCTKCCLRA